MKKFIIGLIVLIIIVVVIAILSGEPTEPTPPGPPPPGVTPPPAVTPPGVTPPPAASTWDKIRAEQVAKTSSEWGKPVLTPISTDAWEDGANISADGNTLSFAYYPRSLINDLATGDLQGTLKLYQSVKPFTTKTKVSKIKKGEIYSEGGLMVSGSDAYYMTNEPISSGDKDNDDNIYKNGELLSFNLPDKSEEDPHYCAGKDELYFWMSNTLLASADENADIYVYKGGKVTKLPAPINQNGVADMQPHVIGANCDTMYFTTNRGDTDSVGPAIYMSKRTGESWSKPTPVIWSTAGGVGEPTLTADGKTLFFVQLFKDGSKFNSDILYVTRK